APSPYMDCQLCSVAFFSTPPTRNLSPGLLACSSIVTPSGRLTWIFSSCQPPLTESKAMLAILIPNMNALPVARDTPILLNNCFIDSLLEHNAEISGGPTGASGGGRRPERT